MRDYRLRRASKFWVRRINSEPIPVHFNGHTIRVQTLCRTCRSAFKNLSSVKRHRVRYSIQNRQGRIDRDITAPSSYDYLRSFLERALDGFDSHHGDEAFSVSYNALVQGRGGGQRTNLSLVQTVN